MTLMSSLRAKLVGAPTVDRVTEALDATEDVANALRELRHTIAPYAKMDDPFIAMWHNHFEAEQERRIYMGPER